MNGYILLDSIHYIDVFTLFSISCIVVHSNVDLHLDMNNADNVILFISFTNYVNGIVQCSK